MSRNRDHAKKAIRLSLLFLWIGIVASTGFGQNEKEPVLVRLSEFDQTYHSEASGLTRYQTSAFQVPQGKRLVIEQIFFELKSGSSTVKPTAKIQINANTWAGLP